MPICPRIHFYEICDQSWCPDYFRHMVQSCLALAWRFRVPVLQKEAPAKHAAKLLIDQLGSSVTDYTYVDFCAGAGGPTPWIERDLNRRLAAQRLDGHSMRGEEQKVITRDMALGEDEGVKFVLTDLYPHIPEWERAAAKSKNISFVPKPVDATNAPRDLLDDVVGAGGMPGGVGTKKVFRMFNLAFHHFDDDLAKLILKNTLETANGFAIFELQERTASSLLMVILLGFLTILTTPIQFPFWNYPHQFFWSCIIPVVPFILSFDGLVSSLRTRTPEEVVALMKEVGVDMDEWELRSGHEMHTWPIGYLTWNIVTRKSKTP